MIEGAGDDQLNLRTVPTVTGTEEMRAFFQRRLAGAGLVMLILAGGSWVLLGIVYLLARDAGTAPYSPTTGSGPFHLAGGLAAGVIWLIARRGRRSAAVLHVLDIAGTLTILTLLTVGAALNVNPIVARLISLLCFNTAMLARAIVVPSTDRRTVLLGLAGAVPVIGLAAWRGVSSEGGVVGSVAAAACWTATAIALATVASRTIFRLRGEVQQARVLGQYTLEAKIGEGGMGEVWRARHALLRRPTAVKLLPPGRAGEAAIRRFEREVQITASLRHPSTVAIYDYGRTREGVFYYAMEFLEGMDLERLVCDHGHLPAGRVVHILAQVCGALAEAHDFGLVHRDVKPANVLLLPRQGEPELAKVVDFGLVKDLQGPSGARADLTAANTITGTPLYMAPEAVQNPESISAASDLYGVGAVGWFLLVGRPLFEGASIIEVCSKHLHEQPPRPSQALGSPIPGDLEDILLACLEKKPTSRPRGARDLRRELRACSVASAWSEEDAAAWWHQHEGKGPTASGPVRSRTIALDVAVRASTSFDRVRWRPAWTDGEERADPMGVTFSPPSAAKPR